jgi:hypothetical protein
VVLQAPGRPNEEQSWHSQSKELSVVWSIELVQVNAAFSFEQKKQLCQFCRLCFGADSRGWCRLSLPHRLRGYQASG